MTTPTMRLRFDGVTRAVHWATAALGLIALVTGTILYVPELSATVGMRATLKDVHVFASLLLVVPLALGAAAGRSGRGLRADLVELSRWSTTDWRWLRRRTRGVPAGKFNGGQKLATALFAGLFTMQLLTGLLMFRPNAFPDAWRTGATFVHDWAYIGLAIVTVGHILKALSEGELLQSMLGGMVSRTWAERERPTWTDR
ncbi:MAG TPA: cytochrome b/b6 domain-containing protein [Acidimicrobiales bacterium]|nr:cytochrome b/b6 domain-containing protein [Acidimicrobiales bacterium]